jgi:hypothetical protein
MLACGDARSRAISDNMSTNICRGTAISTIWQDDLPDLACDLSTDLNQPLEQADRRPRGRSLWHSQHAHGVGDIVRLEVQAHRVGGERAA